MSWSAWGETLLHMLDYQHASAIKQRGEHVQARMAEKHDALLAHMHRLQLPSKPVEPYPHKCPGCGSHEFRRHHGVRICAYCRTAESGCVEAPFILGQGLTP